MNYGLDNGHSVTDEERKSWTFFLIDFALVVCAAMIYAALLV